MKPFTGILIGAGQRGLQVYGQYALDNPGDMQVVAVAEPDAQRRQLASRLHRIPEDRCFESWEELLALPKLADFAMVCTQDRQHYRPVVRAMEQGYHVLCEKPMSPDPQECKQMGELSEKYGRILSICHVLRYSPFFTKVKSLLDSGVIGDLVSVQHIENVAYWHQAHSFVRGNWRRSDETSPMILQKSCHDMDILNWLVGRECLRVSSYGGLKHFRAENAPAGSTPYCLDGCAVLNTCPYSAAKIYLHDEMWYSDVIRNVVSPDTSKEGLTRALRNGPYGRCVYRCDNNVVDHQVVNLEFEGNITASFTMCGFTYGGGRTINLMGTRGQILGDMEGNRIQVIDFLTGNEDTITIRTASAAGHSGSDEGMMRDFIRLLRDNGSRPSTSAASISVTSHLMALAAEKSRVENRTVDMADFIGAL